MKSRASWIGMERPRHFPLGAFSVGARHMAPIYAQVVLLRALPEIQVVLESTGFCTKKYVHLFLVLKVRRRVVSDGNHLVFFHSRWKFFWLGDASRVCVVQTGGQIGGTASPGE